MGLSALQTLTTTHVEPKHMLVGAHLRNLFVGNVMIVGHNQAYEQEGPSYWLALCRSVLRHTTSASKIIAL